MKKYTYYKIKKEHIPYCGARFFQVDNNSFESVSIVLSTGDVKKGKANQVGIYTISKLTIMSNYIAMNRCEEITKKTYLKAFKNALLVLM